MNALINSPTYMYVDAFPLLSPPTILQHVTATQTNYSCTVVVNDVVASFAE